jgi:hypothetical protein
MDYSSLPPEVHQQLADLELELKEGDITQKGYEKRKAKILQPYQQSKSCAISFSLLGVVVWLVVRRVAVAW